MRPGDFLLATFGSEALPVVRPAEIRFVDLVARTFDCVLADGGRTLTVDFSPGAAPWPSTDEFGAQDVLATHTIWTPEDASPGQGDVALLAFADGTKALAIVESIAATVSVQLYQQPYPRISLDLDTIVHVGVGPPPCG
jgi:hypothetical protein